MKKATIEETIQTICDTQPFFTTIVKSLDPVEEPDVPTLGTDGMHLYYNPKFWDENTNEEKCAVVLHETLHCAFNHMWRKGTRDQFKWNMATDYAINPMVDENFKLPKGGLISSKYYGMSAEDIYKALPKDKKQKQQQWCDKGHWGDQDKKQQGGGSSQQQKNKSGQSKDKKGKDGGEGKDKKSKGGGGGLLEKIRAAMGNDKDARLKQKEAEWNKTLNSPKVQAKWEKIFNDQILKEYGHAPDSIKRVIEKEFYIPVVDWASLVASILSEDTTDYTFTQPDRRYSGSDFMLPGMHAVDTLKDVVFAYDTSGSITKEDLESYYHETMALFDNFLNYSGWIAICDAWLHHFKEINHEASFDDFSFMGGGGTDFKPVFDEIKRRSLKPKALFYFTDTFGDFPSQPPEYPVFWLVRTTIGDNEPREVPFGTVVKFMDKTK